jgi:transcriptional regulator with XRE-family HTH domain
MSTAEALRETMEELHLRVEHVAVAADVSSQAVRAWLAGKTEPSRPAYDRLRHAYKGFAMRMDRAVA